VNESRMTRIGTGESVADECRRLGELLDLDAVGIAAVVDGERRVASWSDAGPIEETPELERVLAGSAEGWLVAALDDGAVVFGRLTSTSSPRAESVLRAVGPSLAHGLEDRYGSRRQVSEADLSPVHKVLASTRSVLENPDSSVTDLLFALRESLGADEVFHFVDRLTDVEVTSSPATDRLRRIPPEIRAKVQGLRPSEALEEATARQLAVVLGATTPFVCAGFCRDDNSTEVLLVGWRTDAGVTPSAINLIARVNGAAMGALGAHRRAVDTQLMRERNRWAYEIHDGVTQAVTTSVLELEALTHKIQRDPREAIETLSLSKTEIRKALSELRGILFELSKERSNSPRHDEPLTKYVQDVVRRWRLPARVTVKGDLFHVPKPLLGAAYVVIRESLANAAKHASAGNVSVWVNATEDEMFVEVTDTGRGFNAGHPRTDTGERHFGLEMMRQRVAEAGGTLDVDSAPGRGTRVTARLPIEGKSGST
jgi:signal transduction histidine kinase